MTAHLGYAKHAQAGRNGRVLDDLLEGEFPKGIPRST